MRYVAAIYFVNLFILTATGETLPSSISCNRLPSGEYQYIIQGIYTNNAQYISMASECDKMSIPGCMNIIIDSTNRLMTFTTIGVITGLQYYIDLLAQGGGVVPYWEEMKLRERKDPSFNPCLYQLAFRANIMWPDRSNGPGLLSATNHLNGLLLTLFSKVIEPHNKSFLIDYLLTASNGTYKLKPLSDERWIDFHDLEKGLRNRDKWKRTILHDAKGQTCYAALNKTTAYCMSHSKYALRVFNENDQFLWENQDDAFGSPYILTYDLSGDGVDEIVLYEEEHGLTHLIVFEESGKFQPARRGYLDPASGLKK